MPKYLNWEYSYEGKKVKPNKKYNFPKTFFKYYALTDNSVNALVNMYVYASHPALLNDPFDCDCELAKIEDGENAKILWGHLYDEAISICGNNKKEFLEFSTQCFSTIIFRKYGILSLTESNDNKKMWALYAQNSGFCLEWDVKEFIFDTIGPFPIHYVDKIKSASTKDYSIRDLVLIQSNVKQRCWEDEKEWRLLILSPAGFEMKTFGKDADKFNQFPDHDRKFKYPVKSLKSITLGPNFFKDVYERNNIISKSPYEVHVCYQEECNQTKVLDYLATIGKSIFATNIAIKVIVKDGLDSRFIPVFVMKVSDLTYRIIEMA